MVLSVLKQQLSFQNILIILVLWNLETFGRRNIPSNLTALKHGFYTLIHCIGDRAVHLVINVISRVEQENLPGNLRNRLEHIQSIPKEDIPRLKLHYRLLRSTYSYS